MIKAWLGMFRGKSQLLIDVATTGEKLRAAGGLGMRAV